MKQLFYLIAVLILPLATFAQKEANNWYFGRNAGVKFFEDGTVAALPGGQMQTAEGCSSISDSDGNLLFYTDGRTVWDRNHLVMPNGDYTGGTGLLGDPSSTQSGIIIPKKNNPNIYYIFTVDEPHHANASVYPEQYTGTYDEPNGPQSIPDADDGYNNGFNYSVVDLSIVWANGSIGDVVTRNVALTTYNPNDAEQIKYKCSEKITAVKNADGSGYWVITHFVDRFYAFLVNADGVNATPVVTQMMPAVPVSGYRRNAIGCLKASPDGKYLAIAHQQIGTITGGAEEGGVVYLYNFDKTTGQVSNPVLVDNNISPYGVEFSPLMKKLYVSYQDPGNGASHVKQYTLGTTAIQATAVEISTGNTPTTLQLGPNGRIYKSVNGGTVIDEIRYPDLDGAACGYINNAVGLPQGTTAVFGLPPFITSLFYATIQQESTCFGEPTQFSLHVNSAFDSVSWNFGDGSAVSAQEAPQHTYTATGTYTVVATVTYQGNTEVVLQSVNITAPPLAAAPPDITECDTDDDGLTQFNLAQNTPAILGSQNPANYTVYYYTSQEDADSNSNPVNGNAFANTVNPQNIYARVVDNTNTKCYATTSFQIRAAVAATLSNTVFTVCDNKEDGSDTNGKTVFNLTGIAAQMITDTNYSVTWYASEENAINTMSAIGPNLYTNATTVYALIKNLTYTQCTYIQPVSLVVAPLPPVVNNAVLIQCDLGTAPDGITRFNLHEGDRQFTNGNTSLAVTYFYSAADAEGNIDEITDAYTNTTANDVLYAKVTNVTTACYRVQPITLGVTSNVLPVVELQRCDDDGTEDGLASFDLSETGYGSGSEQVVYYASENNALLEVNPLSSIFTTTVAHQQAVYARIENNNECVAIAKVILNVRSLPAIAPDETAVVCLNTREFITLESTVYGAQYSYLWSTGAATSSIMVNEPGVYTVTVTDNSHDTHCTKTRTITVNPSNIAEITNIEVNDLSRNNTVTVLATPAGGVETTYLYSLDAPNGPWQESPYFENVAEGLHIVYVYDAQGCGVVKEQIGVLVIPNYFTPNGDGFNDTWAVPGLAAARYKGSKLYVFDRYGKLLLDIDASSKGWDGTFGGRPMPGTDYWYVLQVNDGRTVKGHFSLVR